MNNPDNKPTLALITTLSSTMRAFFIPYADYFRKLGWRVDAICRWTDQDDDLKGHFDQTIELTWQRSPWHLKNFDEAGKIRNYTRERKPDIVHVHTPVAGFVTRWALRNFRDSDHSSPEVIYTVHGFHFHRYGSLFRNWLFLRLEKLAASWCSQIITVNSEDFAAVRKYGLKDENHSLFIPGVGISIEDYSATEDTRRKARARLREELGISQDATCLLSVGELNPEKHQATLIKALALSGLPENSGIHLLLAGEGPLREDLETLSRDCELQKHVHFLGFRRDIPHLLHGSDGFVYASSREGLPRCIMEAMAARVPILAVDARGTRDLLEDGCGILIKHGPPYRMKDGMRQLVAMKDHGDDMVKNARNKLKKLHIENILNMHRQFYEKILNS